jgi:hypothetical protein
MSNKIVARLEGDCSYSDGTRNSFAVSLDDDGTIVPDGAAAVMGDIISTVKGLFTALGGTLTCTPPTSGKTVTDKTAVLVIQGTYGATPDAEADFTCSAEYSLKTGTHISGDGASGYTIAKTNFNSSLDAMITAMAGVAVTVA